MFLSNAERSQTLFLDSELLNSNKIVNLFYPMNKSIQFYRINILLVLPVTFCFI